MARLKKDAWEVREDLEDLLLELNDCYPVVIPRSEDDYLRIEIEADLFDEECERGSELTPEDFEAEVEKRFAARKGSKT